MVFYIVQFLTGLASAASLFLVASGLSIIFGVTRIVNFAHGAFYMLGAYLAYSLIERLEGALGFWSGVLLAALIVAAIGVLVEMALLRRIYHSPELFQLLATFGLTFTSPFGGVEFRAIDHQSTLGAFVGKTAVKDGKGIMVESVYRKGSDYLPRDAEVEKMRPKE